MRRVHAQTPFRAAQQREPRTPELVQEKHVFVYAHMANIGIHSHLAGCITVAHGPTVACWSALAPSPPPMQTC
eukprot:1162107-Pelagomonas_calceolata.AAC.7